MRTNFLIITLVLLIFGCKEKKSNATLYAPAENLKINQVQVIGSHNSYRQKTYQPIFDFVLSLGALIPAQFDPSEWDYEHLPLLDQLGIHRMRNLELDLYYDPQGGHFYHRKGLAFVGEETASGVDELLEPGFKLLHIPDFDYLSHHYTFKGALREILKYSIADPKHLPLYLYIETKSGTVADQLSGFDLTTAVPLDAAAVEAIDNEIKEVFTGYEDKIYTPDKLRGSYATIKDAIEADKWPTVSEARGKIFFILDGGLIPFYLQANPMLANRQMFVFTKDVQPHTAFIIANNSIADKNKIQSWVKEGFIVRTRADAGTTEARTGDYSRMEAAFSSGAQIITTDYYVPDKRHATDTAWTNYSVSFPQNEKARVNPVNTEEDAWDWRVNE